MSNSIFRNLKSPPSVQNFQNHCFSDTLNIFSKKKYKVTSSLLCSGCPPCPSLPWSQFRSAWEESPMLLFLLYEHLFRKVWLYQKPKSSAWEESPVLTKGCCCCASIYSERCDYMRNPKVQLEGRALLWQKVFRG